MKSIIFILVILVSACSSSSSLDELLTTNNWEVEKSIDIRTGAVTQTKKNQEKIWDFKLGNTYRYDFKKEKQEQNISGKWLLKGYNLLIINEFDSTRVLIEKITNDEMVWLIDGEDSVRFFLTSIDRKAIVPESPDLPNSNLNDNLDN